MAELINLRMARKHAKRRDDDASANAQRLAHGQPKHQVMLETARQEKADRNLEQHQIEKGDRR